MKNFLKENWFKILIAVIFVIFIGGVFFWYEWRPAQTKKECANWAIESMNKDNAGRGYVPVAERADRNHKDFNNYYERGLREKGL